MDLEASLDRMCMGVEELNFRLARIEIALRKQNLRIRLSEAVIVIKDVSSAHGGPEDWTRPARFSFFFFHCLRWLVVQQDGDVFQHEVGMLYRCLEYDPLPA